MKTGFFIFMAAMTFLAMPVSAEETVKVTGIFQDKKVEFSPQNSAKLVEVSLRLLASCGYQSANAASAKVPGSRLNFTFTPPRHFENPQRKMTFEIQAMEFTFSDAARGFWVRSHDNVTYVTKYNGEVAAEFAKIVHEARASGKE